jgi:hypothetical protein
LSQSDTTKLQVNDIVRLKDFANIKVIDINDDGTIKAQFHSKELIRDYPIIQWVPQQENVKVSILKPDGSISEGRGEINLTNIPLGKPVQFERYGFVNPIQLKNQELFCYFTH